MCAGVAGDGLGSSPAQRAQAQGGVTQLLANLAGTQGWHLLHALKVNGIGNRG